MTVRARSGMVTRGRKDVIDSAIYSARLRRALWVSATLRAGGNKMVRRFVLRVHALSLAGCLALLAACSDTGGSALFGDGAAATGIIGITHAQRGHDYRFAFPGLVNHTDQPVHVTGLAMQKVAPNVKVVGFSAYRLSVVGQRYADWIDGEASRNGVRLDLPKYRSPTTFTIPPRTPSDTVPMVIARLIGNPHTVRPELDGCMVHYKTGAHSYTQTLTCTYLMIDPSKTVAN